MFAASATDMMGVGFSAGQAALIGETPVLNLAGVGTSQSGAAALTSSFTTVTTAASQTAFVLPSTWPLNNAMTVYNNSATSALVFPPSGGAIDNGSANASVSIAQNKPRVFVRVSTLVWISVAGA
jgi:hypothetical protein